MKALEECDVCIVIIDAERGVEAQDVNLISLAQRQGKGIVLMVNKWDLIEKDSRTSEKFKKDIQERLAPIDYLPIIFASVINKQRIYQVMEKAVEVYDNNTKKVPTSKLNDTILTLIERNPPPSTKGKMVQIKYITQVNARFPSFAFLCNLPQYVLPSYQGYLENRIRENFDFEGVPIRLIFRKK